MPLVRLLIAAALLAALPGSSARAQDVFDRPSTRPLPVEPFEEEEDEVPSLPVLPAPPDPAERSLAQGLRVHVEAFTFRGRVAPDSQELLMTSRAG